MPVNTLKLNINRMFSLPFYSKLYCFVIEFHRSNWIRYLVNELLKWDRIKKCCTEWFCCAVDQGKKNRWEIIKYSHCVRNYWKYVTFEMLNATLIIVIVSILQASSITFFIFPSRTRSLCLRINWRCVLCCLFSRENLMCVLLKGWIFFFFCKLIEN